MIGRIKVMLRRLSLGQKISAAVILLIFFIMLIVNILIFTRQQNLLKEELSKNHLVVTNNLSKDAVEPLIIKDPLRLDEIVRLTAQTPGCIYAAIIDFNKRIVAHTDRRWLGAILSDETQVHSHSVADNKRARLADSSNPDIKEIRIPINAGYEEIGLAIAGFSKDSIDMVIENNLRELKNHLLLISSFVMLIGIWGSFWLARLLTMPMKKLKDKMELVQTGNLNVEVANDYLVNCWDVLGCNEKNCPAYGKQRCWTISATKCNGKQQGDVFQKIHDCRNCPVYKESCGDEVGELIEVFNQMIKRLNESIMELEEKNRENARLEKLSALGEMSMTVAHEIKNPLNAIKGAVSYLQSNFKGDVLKEFLYIIEQEVKRLNEIVTTFLRFSKPSPLQTEVDDINRVIKETVELIRQEATENNVEVVTSLDGGLPLFEFDSRQLKQAFLNILVNSLDATKAGDTIWIITENKDSRAVIKIRDSGEGISEELISEIFKPFFTTKTRGSGLGLACVERIIKDHKGDISVRSEPGKGAEFEIILPITIAPK